MNLRDGLSRRGVIVSIITGEGEPDENVDTVGLGKIMFILRAFMLTRKMKPEIIHSQAHWYILIPMVICKAFHPRTVLVHTFHTDPLKHVKGIKRKIFTFLLSKCDHVTFVSKALMKKYTEEFNIQFKSASVIYAGVSIHKASMEKQKEFVTTRKLAGRYPVLCFLGPLAWKMKVEGVKRLISALEIVRKTHPSAILIIVGDGEYREELELLVKDRNLSGNVIFTGFQKEPQIPLSVADIYTHITLQEGQSIALLEAMALGKPIIASITGGIPEVIKDRENGLLVESEPEIIAHKIIELAGDRELMETLGMSARKTAIENHSWVRTVEEFMKIYKNGKVE